MESANKIVAHDPGAYGDRAGLQCRKHRGCETFQSNGTVGIGKGKEIVMRVSLDKTNVRRPGLECDACRVAELR